MIPEKLRGLGFRFTKLHPVVVGDKTSGKNPIGNDWQTLNNSFTEDEIDTESYGISCNFGGACVIDIDLMEAYVEFKDKLPRTLTDGIGEFSRHYIYRCPDLRVGPFNVYHPTQTDGAGNRVKILEIKSGSCNVVGPLAPNWRGGRREIIDDSPVRTITLAELKAITKGYEFAPRKNISFDQKIKQLKSRKPSDALDIDQILDHFGWAPTVENDVDWKGTVPCHDSVSETCLAIHRDDGVWYCHACQAGGNKESLILLLNGDIKCTEHRSVAKLRGKIKSLVQEIQGGIAPGEDQFPQTEGGNAQRLKKMFGEDILYCPQNKTWYIWDGNRWKSDKVGKIYDFARQVVDYLYSLGEDYRIFAQYSDGVRGYNNMVKQASRFPDLAVDISELDADPMKMAFDGVTIDFRTCKVLVPDRSNKITLLAGCKFDPDASGGRWQQFIEEVFPNEEVRDYVQRCVGYGISGDMSEKCFFYGDDATGDGDNGKSVLLNVIRTMCGEYGHHANISTFMRKRQASEIRDDLVNLRGTRFITAGEPNENAVLDMEVLKPWTGRDPIRARAPFQNEIQYNPQGTIWIVGNNRPLITETTMAAWDRFKVIPFFVSFKGRIDNKLQDKLVGELPIVLNWALEGYKKYKEHGLTRPKIVEEVFRDYKQSCNSLESFINVDYRAIIFPGQTVRTAEFHRAYKDYCEENDLYTLPVRKVRKYLIEQVPTVSVMRKNFGEVYVNIGLRDHMDSAVLESISEVCQKKTPVTGGMIKKLVQENQSQEVEHRPPELTISKSMIKLLVKATYAVNLDDTAIKQAMSSIGEEIEPGMWRIQ